MAAGDIIIMAQQEIQVFVNGRGAIAIKQVCTDGDEDQLVDVLPQNVDALIAALADCKMVAIAIAKESA